MLWTALNRTTFLLMNSSRRLIILLVRAPLVWVQGEYLPGLQQTCFNILHVTYVGSVFSRIHVTKYMFKKYLFSIVDG